MKQYNRKLLEATKKISNKAYQKAMDDAQKATHPSQKVLKKGAIISSIVGFALLTVGVACIFSKREKWALGFVVSGVIIIIINFTNITKE